MLGGWNSQHMLLWYLLVAVDVVSIWQSSFIGFYTYKS